MSNNLRGETISLACSCFFEISRNIQQENLVYLTRKFRLKHLIRSGKSRRREVIMLIWLDKIKDERYSKEKKDKFFIGKEIVANNQLFELVFWLSELNVDAFVMGKPEFSKNFSTDGERRSLENI
jgi:hypothetical protein